MCPRSLCAVRCFNTQTAVDVSDICTWWTTVILIMGKTWIPPIRTPYQNQYGAGSGISGLYLWLHLTLTCMATLKQDSICNLTMVATVIVLHSSQKETWSPLLTSLTFLQNKIKLANNTGKVTDFLAFLHLYGQNMWIRHSWHGVTYPFPVVGHLSDAPSSVGLTAKTVLPPSEKKKNKQKTCK